MIPTQMLKDDIDNHNPELALLPGAISAGTLLVAFTLLAAGFEYFWVTFILGFGVVLPTAVGLSLYSSRTQEQQPSSRTEQSDDAALAALRRRYAHGELSDAEFEHRVEQLLETESSEHSHNTVTPDRE